jgi:hypothetical protein
MSDSWEKDAEANSSVPAEDSELDAELRAILEPPPSDVDQRLALQDVAWAEECFKDLQSLIHAQDDSFLGRLASWPSWVRHSAAVAVGAVTVALVFVLQPRSDLYDYPAARMALALLSLFALGIWLGGDALRGWHRPALSRQDIVLRVALSLTLLVGLSILPVPVELSPYTVAPRGVPLFAHASRCFLYGLAVALPTFFSCRFLGHHAPYTNWMAAVVSGIVGNLALQVHCPITEHSHLLAGHTTIGVAVLAYAAVPLLLARWRDRRSV